MTAGAAKDLIDNLNDLRIFIDQLETAEAKKIFKTASLKEHQRKGSASIIELSDDEIENMPIPQIQSLLKNEDVSKITLLRIAIKRFGEPKGSASKHSRVELVEKISNYIGNEVGHESIKRLIKSSAGDA
ncbi:hypothetical protein [Agrobacterium cavarae]